jgi:hypothetical protein
MPPRRMFMEIIYLKTVDIADFVDALAVREQALASIESWLDAPP